MNEDFEGVPSEPDPAIAESSEAEPVGTSLADVSIDDIGAGDVIKTEHIDGMVVGVDVGRGTVTVERPNKQGEMEQKELSLDAMKDVLKNNADSGFHAELVKADNVESSERSGEADIQEVPGKPSGLKNLWATMKGGESASQEKNKADDTEGTESNREQEKVVMQALLERAAESLDKESQQALDAAGQERMKNLLQQAKDQLQRQDELFVEGDAPNETLRQQIEADVRDDLDADMQSMLDDLQQMRETTLLGLRMSQDAVKQMGDKDRLKALQDQEAETIERFDEQEQDIRSRLDGIGGSRAA